MARKTETTVPERVSTARSALLEALLGTALTAREISVRAAMSEKDVTEHLEHLERSLRRQGQRLVVDPARCLACAFVFKSRTRFSTPGSCPECRSERVAPPAFRVEGAGR